MRYLPLGLDVVGKKCLVVGGGTIGCRKALTLQRAGALVTVVSPVVTEELAEQVQSGSMAWLKDRFCEEHLAGAFLVVAATDDAVVNGTVTSLGRQQGALVCDASAAERSQIIFGALLDVDEATIAVFTDGRDPAKARRTRDEIAHLLPPGHDPEKQNDGVSQ